MGVISPLCLKKMLSLLKLLVLST